LHCDKSISLTLYITNFVIFFNMNIFIAKLNFRTTGDVLKEIFEQFGEVSSAKVIMDHATGRSKGYGFVEMPNDDEATRAIDELNNADIEGNKVVVKKANPKNEGGSDQRSYRSRTDR
jgi:RNA recognition motif-containing protein